MDGGRVQQKEGGVKEKDRGAGGSREDNVEVSDKSDSEGYKTGSDSEPEDESPAKKPKVEDKYLCYEILTELNKYLCRVGWNNVRRINRDQYEDSEYAY